MPDLCLRYLCVKHEFPEEFHRYAQRYGTLSHMESDSCTEVYATLSSVARGIGLSFTKVIPAYAGQGTKGSEGSKPLTKSAK